MPRDPRCDAYTGLPKGSWRLYENRTYNGDRSTPSHQSYTVRTVPPLDRQQTRHRNSYDTHETHKSHSRSDPRNRVTASYVPPKAPVSTAKTYDEGTDAQTQQYYDFKDRSDSLGVTDYSNDHTRKARRLLHKPNANGFSSAELRSGKLVSYTARPGYVLVYRNVQTKTKTLFYPPGRTWVANLVFSEDEYEVAEVEMDRMNGLEEPEERVKVVKDREFKSFAR